ncbi:unnamed protein product [Spirodela intermedia]|uniref:CNH domain-containing protein n=1 Tax=Spirodela intermedia TaxID=51605 RepID=A0A7I8J3C1_SPIIN|nr:unnamed protein product [Spirodela intermedia]CAA6663891.1 unnamed protein product [Spirodela intermedia]
MDRSGRPKNRTVLEAFAEFDPSNGAFLSSASSPLVICSLTVSTSPDGSESQIYVGTLGGSILLLSLLSSSAAVPSKQNGLRLDGDAGEMGRSDASSPANIEVVQSASVGRSPVEVIQVFPEVGRLIVLSEGFLFLLDVLLLQPAHKLAISGATALSRRLVCSDLASSDPLGYVASKSEKFGAGQRFLQKLGGGNRANGVTSKVHVGQRAGEVNCFLAVAAGRKLVLLELSLGRVRTGTQGSMGAVRTIAWLDDSIIIGTTGGYALFSTATGQSTPLFSLPEFSGPPQLKPLFKSKEALLFVDNVGIVVNSFGQPVGGSLVFQQFPDSITEVPPYIIVSGDGWMDLYRKNTGICVQSASYPKGNGRPCLVAVMIRVVICFNIISAEEQIKELLRKKYFKEAICLVEECESDGEMTKEMLSFVHAQDAVNHFLLSETMQPSEIFPFIMQEPNRWSTLVPRNRYWGLHPPPALLENVVDEGLAAIQRAVYLRKAGIDTTVDEDFLLNPPSKVDLLESAIENIIRYLLVSRDKDMNPSVKEGVDTLLIYLYRALNRVGDMEHLASSQNSCVVEELETLLVNSGHSRTLAFLYASKGMNSKALTIWRKLARTYSAGLWIDPATVHLFSSQRAAALEASKLLEESSDQHLILQHLGWSIADEDPELAVRILTSERRSCQPAPEEVLAAIDPKKDDIRQRYLQWLIEDQDFDDPQLHTLYALSLAKSVIGSTENDGTIETRRLSEMNVIDAGEGSIRERLQLFLHGSDLYDAEKVLYVIEETELWLEKAILYRKLGQENLVLQILALKLEDSEAAEQYCVEIGRADAFMHTFPSSSVHPQAPETLLDPENGKQPMFKAAVRLLHRHGESLDPLQVLERLSPDMPLHLASETILRMLRARVHHHRQGQVVSKVSHALKLEAELARLEERSRHVQINDESICDSCRTRLGTKLFAIYPDDSIVCYKSISARGRDFTQDIVFKPGWLVSRSP